MADLSGVSTEDLKAYHEGRLQDVSTEGLMALRGASPAAPAVAEAPNTAADVAQSFGSGLVRGAAETAMLPITVPRAISDVSQAAMNGAGRLAYDYGFDPLKRAIMGQPQATPAEMEQRYADRAKRDKMIADSDFIGKAQDSARALLDENLHKPETTAGKYAGTIGEFAVPGGAFGKGGKVARAVGDIIVPAVTSETAGQVAHTLSPENEDIARFVGALFGSGATGVVRSKSVAPETSIRKATKGVTPEQWDDAERLVNNNYGVNVSGPNALQQATNGGTKLGSLQRVVEGSSQGGSVMAPFFNQVPDQFSQALEKQILDRIAPRSTAPTAIGPRVQAAAQGVIDDTGDAINAASRPAYQAAESATVSPEVFDQLSQDPRFTQAVRRLRGNPEIAPDYANLGDDSVAVIDAVTKDMFARGQAMGNTANPLYGPELGMRNTTAADTARAAAREASPEYDNALNIQAGRRAIELDPLTNGPVGKLANTSDTRQAGEILLPSKPLEGSEMEAFTTAGKLQEQDPDAVLSLIRQRLANSAADQGQDLVGGQNYYGPARFAKDIAGTEQKAANLRAVMGATPVDQAVPASLDELLDVARATGRKEPIGSQTAFNTEVQKDLGEGSFGSQLSNLVKSAGTSFITGVNDAAQRAWLGKNVERLAEWFATPEGLARIREISESAQPGVMAKSIKPGLTAATQLQDGTQ